MFSKIGDEIWDDHDQYNVCLFTNGTHCVYKNNQYHDKYDIEECPENIQESLNLELGRIKSNHDANSPQISKTQKSK